MLFFNGKVLVSNNLFFRAFLGTASLQMLGRGLSVVTGIVFARLLGPEDFGRYSFVISSVVLISLPAVAGLPQLLVRETSKYSNDNEYDLLLGIWKWSGCYILFISTIAIISVLVLLFFGFWQESISSLMILGLLLVPLKSYLPGVGAIISGLERPTLAQIPLVIVAPLITLFLICIIYLIQVELTANYLLLIQVLSHLFALVVGIYLVNRLVNTLCITGAARYLNKEWRSSLLPFTLVALVGTMNNELATIALGLWGSDEAVGYFKVAMQGVILLALGLQAVNTVSGPRIASSFKHGNTESTQALLKQSVRLSVIFSLPIALLLIFFSDGLIITFFGKEYLPATELLIVLCVGQIVNVLMGSVGLVLNMTGNEKRTLRAQFITLILTVILLVALIPMFEAVGAAIAVSLGLICWNVIMAFDVYRLTGLKTWIH